MSDNINTWIPRVAVESYSGPREVGLQTSLFSDENKPKVFLLGEITDVTANDFITELLYLTQKGIPSVDIIINSDGGSCNAGLVIADTIEMLQTQGKIELSAYVCGKAASIAAVILSCIKKGKRFALPHSQILIHEPLVAGGISGFATSIKTSTEKIFEVKAVINKILAKNTDHTIEEINEATAFDNLMTVDQAIDFGIVDAIQAPF